MMSKREAVEVILAGRRAAARTGREFIVDHEKLGRFGGFSAAEIDKIEAAVFLIEQSSAQILDRL